MRFYFFRTAEMVNILWGTPSPVKYIEPDYRIPVSLGACGNFSVVISNAEQMFVTLLGPRSDYSASDVQDLVSSRIVAPLSAFLAAQAYPYREVDTHLMEMSADLRHRTDTMERIGRIADMTTEKRAAAEVDLDYMGMQKLEALRDAARNEGGLAGAGLQLGAGVQLAQDIFKEQGAGGDAAERLRKLKKLFDEQLITEEEYEQKKNEILSKL